jgi:hypothetical protein
MKRQEIIVDRGREERPTADGATPSSGNRQKLMVAALIALIAVALGFSLMRRGPDNAVDHPDGFHYVCRNPACKHEFTLTAAEFNDWVGNHPGEYIKCPKCGTPDAKRVGAKERSITPIKK